MNSPVNRQIFDELLRRDFSFFLFYVFATLHPGQAMRKGWHIRAMAYALSLTTDDDLKRLLITIPPRHLKSITVSVAFVAWMMGKDPRLKFLVASYGRELAGELASQFRSVVNAAWYRRAFTKFRLSRDVEGEIRTTLGGGRKAVSVGGATTGFGADYIIVDDLMKAADANSPGLREATIDYFRGSLVSRLNDPEQGRIIVIAQRLHEDDVPGYCLETGLYRHLNLPAIAQGPAVVPLGAGKVKRVQTGDLLYLTQATLDGHRRELGDSYFSAQYLQDPTPAESQFVRWHKIGRYAVAPPRDLLLKVVQSWDTAEVDRPGRDYSVCTTWGFYEGKWFLLHLDRFRGDYTGIKARARLLIHQWRPDVVLIEDMNSGRGLVSEFRFEAETQPRARALRAVDLQAITPVGSKVVRWAAQAAKLEEGYALLPEDAPWLDDLRREVSAFPNGRHDDQIDSISQFLQWSRLRTGRTLMLEHNQRAALRGLPIHREDWDDDDWAVWDQRSRA